MGRPRRTCRWTQVRLLAFLREKKKVVSESTDGQKTILASKIFSRDYLWSPQLNSNKRAACDLVCKELRRTHEGQNYLRNNRASRDGINSRHSFRDKSITV